MLLRFGVAWLPETNTKWAFPTIKKTSGVGYYVKLKKKILEKLQKGDHKAVFRGTAIYRSDMIEHVEQLIFKQSWIDFSRHALDSYDIISPKTTATWVSQQSSSVMGYQCILVFDPVDTRMICELNHKINDQHHIPCYNMNQFWTEDEINKIKTHFNNKEHLALGVPKRLDTVPLAMNLWRCQQFIR